MKNVIVNRDVVIEENNNFTYNNNYCKQDVIIGEDNNIT